MATSWVKSCFERGRLRPRNRKGTKQLDERYGDMDISGPMDGGWNQVPVYLSEKRNASMPVSRNGSQHEKDKAGTIPHYRADGGTQPYVWVNDNYPKPASSASQKPPDFVYKPASEAFFKDMAEIGRVKHLSPSLPPPSSSTPSQKPPDFVYKPASEAFFKDMAEIGRAKHPSPPLHSMSSTSSTPLDIHRRQISTQSLSSLEPTMPSDIPCHPSYNPNMGLGRRTPSPQIGSPPGAVHYNRTPAAAPRTSSPYSRCVSPALSHQSTLDEEPREEELFEKQKAKQLAMSGMRTKTKKSRRVVTAELVPSTTELFG